MSEGLANTMRHVVALAIAALAVGASPCVVDAADWGALVEPKQIEPTDDLRAIAGRDIQRAVSVDFNGDGVEDYIVWAPYAGPEVPGKTFSNTEYWITSEYRVARTRPLYVTPIYKRWLVNLDDDPEPEILVESGYEDGSDFLLYDQTDGLRGQELLLHVQPMLVSEEMDGIRHAWGTTEYLGLTRVIREGDGYGFACSYVRDLDPVVEFEVSPLRPPQVVLPILLLEMHGNRPLPPRHHGFSLTVRTSVTLTLPELVQRSRRPRDGASATGAVAITGPTLIIFSPDVSAEEFETDQDYIEVSGDFEWHTGQARAALERLGATVHTRPGNAVRIRVGDQVRRLAVEAHRPRFGYWLVAPGREPKVLHGVYTDVDLMQEAREYFGRP